MLVSVRPAFMVALCGCLPLTGCLVSFHDYPLASGGSNGASAASGSDAGGMITIGSFAGDLGAGGSAAGDWAIAGSTMAGASAGGAPAGGGPEGGAPTGGMGGALPAGGAPAGGMSGSDQGGTGGAVMPPSDLLIDDFEDGDGQVALIAGRNGSWFAANDGTYRSQQTPDPRMDTLPSLLAPPRGASTRALHTTGSGFTSWGALVGASFLKGTAPAPYDISAHRGLTFVAKLGSSPMATKQVRVSIRNYDTLYGCTGCGDHFGTAVTLTDTFQTITVPFSSLKQQGWGKPQVATFDTTRTYAVTFGWAAYQAFDVWIDDVTFY